MDKTGPKGQGPMTGRGMGNCGANKTTTKRDFGRKRLGFKRFSELNNNNEK